MLPHRSTALRWSDDAFREASIPISRTGSLRPRTLARNVSPSVTESTVAMSFGSMARELLKVSEDDSRADGVA